MKYITKITVFNLVINRTPHSALCGPAPRNLSSNFTAPRTISALKRSIVILKILTVIFLLLIQKLPNPKILTDSESQSSSLFDILAFFPRDCPIDWAYPYLKFLCFPKVDTLRAKQATYSSGTTRKVERGPRVEIKAFMKIITETNLSNCARADEFEKSVRVRLLPSLTITKAWIFFFLQH